MSDGTTRAARHENVGPYMYTRGDVTRADGYRLILYGAYNAMGLIGSEFNGIAVLDNNRMQVWCDNIGGDGTRTGWYRAEDEAPAHLQHLFNYLAMLPHEAFIKAINGESRCRYEVTA